MSKASKAILLAQILGSGVLETGNPNKQGFIDYTLPYIGYDPIISDKSPSPIFIPRKHTKMKYADHKRMKAKRKNRKLNKN